MSWFAHRAAGHWTAEKTLTTGRRAAAPFCQTTEPTDANTQMTQPTSKQIFLSYSRTDLAAADVLRAALEQAGFEVFRTMPRFAVANAG